MGVYDSYLKERKTSGASVYSQYQQSKVAPTQSQGFVSSVASAISKPITFMAGQMQSAFGAKAKTDLNVTRGIVTETAKVWKDTVVDTSTRFNAMMDAWKKPGKNDKLDVTIKTAQAGLGAVNTFFAPITGVMKGLETHPVFGWPAAAINGLFGGIGEGSSEMALSALDKAPWSEATKAKLSPLVSETAALVGMLVAGKAGHSAYTKIKTNTQTILDTVKTEAPKQNVSFPLRVDIPVKDGRKVNGNIRVVNAGDVSGKIKIENKAGEYYPPDYELPVIEFGNKEKTKGPVVQTEPKTPPVKGDFKYEPVTNQQQVPITKPKPVTTYEKFQEVKAKQEFEDAITAFPKAPAPKQVTPSSEKKYGSGYTQFQSEAGLKFKSEAESRGMTNLEEVPYQQRTNNVEQWRTTDELVKNDIERAKRIYRNEEELPKGMERNSIEGSLHKHAVTNGDTALINELIRSKLGTETARELQIRNREFTDSVDVIESGKGIRNARIEEKTAGKTGINIEKETAKLKKSVPKEESIPKSSLEKLINSIKC